MWIHSVAERPDLIGPGWRMPSTLPAFTLESLVAERLIGRVPELFPDLRLVAVEDGPDGEEVVAHVHAVAFSWDGDDADAAGPGRGSPPADRGARAGPPARAGQANPEASRAAPPDGRLRASGAR